MRHYTLVGLESERSRPPHLLSAGQMQRLALAGALAMQPRLMLFDEPTTMIDPAGRRMLMEQIHALKSRGVDRGTDHPPHGRGRPGRPRDRPARRPGSSWMEPRARSSPPPGWKHIGLELPPAEVFGEALRPLIPGLPSHIYTLEMMLEELRGIHPPPGVKTVPPHRSEIPVQNETIIRVEGLGFTYMKDTPMAHRALENTSLQVGARRSARADRRHRQRQDHIIAALERAAQTPGRHGAGRRVRPQRPGGRRPRSSVRWRG